MLCNMRVAKIMIFFKFTHYWHSFEIKVIEVRSILNCLLSSNDMLICKFTKPWIDHQNLKAVVEYLCFWGIIFASHKPFTRSISQQFSWDFNKNLTSVHSNAFALNIKFINNRKMNKPDSIIISYFRFRNNRSW